jgi:hypothetical protein
MKLLFAAPLSGLPSDPIALGAQASRLHFVRKLFFAAPASGLPFLPTALLSHVSCAAAEPIANAVTNTAYINLHVAILFGALHGTKLQAEDHSNASALQYQMSHHAVSH